MLRAWLAIWSVMKPIILRSLQQTCAACPSQWEGETIDGEFLYVRYRFARLSVAIGPTVEAAAGAHANSTDGSRLIFNQNIGDHPLDGFIEWPQVTKHVPMELLEAQRAAVTGLPAATMVRIGDHLVIPLPEPECRQAWNVGEHRMVRAFFAAEGDRLEREDWMCFDHGPECWTTTALRNYLGEFHPDPGPGAPSTVLANPR